MWLTSLAMLCGEVQSVCPNKCSAKGICNVHNQCVCMVGYRGADCSERTCPMGKTWTGFPASTDNLHETVEECSRMGTCSRTTGVCTCFAGFTGSSCERMACPGSGNCNGKGVCMNLKQAAVENDDLTTIYSTTYSLWDAERVYGCICDAQHFGYDCSTLNACMEMTREPIMRMLPPTRCSRSRARPRGAPFSSTSGGK